MKRLLTLIASTMIGLVFSAFGFGTSFLEVHKPSPNIWIAGAFFALGLIGTLMTPFVGDALATAARKGIALGSFGRRAYDGADAKAAFSDIELPPTVGKS
jgi:hypothetical protein